MYVMKINQHQDDHIYKMALSLLLKCQFIHNDNKNIYQKVLN